MLSQGVQIHNHCVLSTQNSKSEIDFSQGLVRYWGLCWCGLSTKMSAFSWSMCVTCGRALDQLGAGDSEGVHKSQLQLSSCAGPPGTQGIWLESAGSWVLPAMSPVPACPCYLWLGSTMATTQESTRPELFCWTGHEYVCWDLGFAEIL